MTPEGFQTRLLTEEELDDLPSLSIVQLQDGVGTIYVKQGESNRFYELDLSLEALSGELDGKAVLLSRPLSKQGWILSWRLDEMATAAFSAENTGIGPTLRIAAAMLRGDL